jgi:polar amino acid transport system substrate-binding protein
MTKIHQATSSQTTACGHARAMIGVVALLITALVNANTAAASTLEQARKSGSIRIGFANEAPFGYAKPSGEATGEAPEIAKHIFKRLGIGRINAVLTEWASLIPGLRAHRFDVVAAGMFVTPERCQQVAFSNPTYRLGQGFLVEAGNPLHLHSYKDAIQSEATVAVMAGAIEHYYAEKAGIPEDRILIVPDQISMLSAVQFGRADAAALTELSIQRMAEKGGDRVEIAAPFKTPDYAYGYGAFAFRKEDTALIKAVNQELGKFIGSKEHLALVAPFGFTQDELPGKMTSAALCGG